MKFVGKLGIGLIVAIAAASYLFRLVETSKGSEARVSQPAPDLAPAVNWLDSYYRKYPVGGGWQFVEAAEEGRRASVSFEIPNNLAKEFESKDTGDKIRVVRNACPNEREAIWKLLSDRQNIEVVLLNQGRLVYNADCK